MKAMLEGYGLDLHWTYPGLTRTKGKVEWKEIVDSAVEEREEMERKKRAALSKSESSKRYNRIKHWGRVDEGAAVFSGEIGRRGARVIERYRDDCNADQGRRLKLMCRAGCLPVLEMIGTTMEWPIAQQACILCNTGQTDTIPHFVTSCPGHAKQRKALVNKIARSLSPEREAWFNALSATELCDVLLGKTIGNPEADDYIDVLVKRFMVKAWKCRKRVQCAIRDTIGWKWLQRV